MCDYIRYLQRHEITQYAQSHGKNCIDAIVWKGDDLVLYKGLETQICVFTDEEFADQEKWKVKVEEAMKMLETSI
jgi:hypothetical protein